MQLLCCTKLVPHRALPLLPTLHCRLVEVAGGALAGAVGEHLWDEHKERREEERYEQAWQLSFSCSRFYRQYCCSRLLLLA